MCFRAAAMTLRTVLLSLQALLAAAEPDDPQDAVVANQVEGLGSCWECATRDGRYGLKNIITIFLVFITITISMMVIQGILFLNFYPK